MRLRRSSHPLRQSASRRFFVYVLWSEKLRKRYVGYTTDPAARVDQHNQGWAKFTSGGIPWRLLYTEAYASSLEAKRRERFLKSGAGRHLLDSLFSKAAPGPAAGLLPGSPGRRLS